MNKARQTVNVLLESVVAAKLPGFGFHLGDEENPTIHPPAVVIRWIPGGGQGKRAESRIRLAQIEVLVGNQDTAGAEAACENVLDGLGILEGQRLASVPKLDFSEGRPGKPTGSQILLSPQLGGDWIPLDPPQQAARLYVYTLEVDYVPRR